MADFDKVYLAPQGIAERTGRISARYRLKDNRFVIDNNDLKMITLGLGETRDSIMSQLQIVTTAEALVMIQDAGKKKGVDPFRTSTEPSIIIAESKQESIENSKRSAVVKKKIRKINKK